MNKLLLQWLLYEYCYMIRYYLIGDYMISAIKNEVFRYFEFYFFLQNELTLFLSAKIFQFSY